MKYFTIIVLLPILSLFSTVYSCYPSETSVTHRDPVNGGWGEWTENQKCSVTCGEGIKIKLRECNKPSPSKGGKPCLGNQFEEIKCRMNACPEWRLWTEWTECSAVCGPGTATRSRECTVDEVPSSLCEGDNLEEKSCNEKECPINGGWSEWTQYGKCSKTCGAGGQRQRIRRCNNPEPQYGGESCSGSDTDEEECNTIDCPMNLSVNGEWGEWTEETLCSTTCGEGSQILVRKCNGQDCPKESALKKVACNLGDCPASPYWSNWSEFSQCSVTCGSGYKTRTRKCLVYDAIVENEKCSGQSESNENCELKGCVVAAKSQSKLSAGMIVVICLSVLIAIGVVIALAVILKRGQSSAKFFNLYEQ